MGGEWEGSVDEKNPTWEEAVTDLVLRLSPVTPWGGDIRNPVAGN